MSNLTFTDLQNEVYDHTGIDSSDSGNQTRVARWLNYVQRDLCARWPWPWMLGRQSLVTIPDYYTGTCSVNAGATSVTGIGTSWAAASTDGGVASDYYIQFSTANDWYHVTAIGSTTSITLENAYQQSTNFVSGTYTLRRWFYHLASNTDEVIDIRNWNTPVKLIQVDLRFIDDLRPNPQSTNAPYGYMMFGTDSSGNTVFTPYPFPSDSRLFEFRVKVRPTDMSSGGDLPTVPPKYAHVIAWGAIAIALAYQKRPEAVSWSEKYEQRIAQMKGEYKQSRDWQPILKSIDSVQRSKWIQMPEQYPVITSG